MEIQQAFISALDTVWAKVAAFIPNLVAGVLIVAVGYMVAKLFAKAVTLIGRRIGLDRAGERVGMQRMLADAGLVTGPADLIGRMVFWLTILVFLITAADTLGLNAVSRTIDGFVLFLPKVAAALVIGVLGLMLAQLVRDVVHRGCGGLGIEYAKSLGGLAYGAVVVVVVTLAIGQLEIDTDLLHMVIGIVLVMVGIAGAISLGLGTRDVARNIVTGVYARESFQAGMRIRCGEHEGLVVEVGAVDSVIATADGRRVYVPNSTLMGQVVEVLDDQRDS